METDGKRGPIEPNLLAVVRPSASRNLIVTFNGYGYGTAPFTRPDLPFETALAAYKKLPRYDAHLIWFAEIQRTWYLGDQEDIVRKITNYILDHQIEQVKLLGGSAGGYAAFRTGLLVDEALKKSQCNTALLSFSFNPQTGFRPELIERVRTAVSGTRFSSDFGTNPILLSNSNYERYKHQKIDFSEFVSEYKPRNFAAVILSDLLNPIEKSFCDDVPSVDYIMLFPHYLGLGHAEGGEKIYHEGRLFSFFDEAMPFPRLEKENATELRLLTECETSRV
ncbi:MULTISPECIES: hypothetical protein [Rhizobium]|uniref:hypothetical protein n=1 Tax=Rhizobium TaxID=379 RepID=UPI00195C8372|nr:MULTISPECIES: hypothetical protein [Rhizobium]MBM7048554.1 hypothetical protein [Rhizobium lusitanum]